MRAMFRIGTGLGRKNGFGRLALGALLLTTTHPAFAQEDDGAMDEDQAEVISCDDGTRLSALFGETGVEITLEDGVKVTLPQKDNAKGFLYTNGKFSLTGDDNSVQWTVGKKVPMACHFEDDQAQPAHFDQPLTVDTAPLPKDKANPDAQPQINCYRFAGFMVKEIDLGEKGAESLAVDSPDAACERASGKNEKLVQDDSAGYFFGAKDNLAFFQGADAWNGGLPFVVYDTKTMKRLFDDSFVGNDFESLQVNGTNVTMTYRRAYSADCALFKDTGACAESIKKSTGLGGEAALPDCTAAYEAEIKRTPDYAKEIAELPSVISYDAQLTYDGNAVTIKPLKGETECSVPT